MPQSTKLSKRIFSIRNIIDFNEAALEIFHFQYKSNLVYNRFVDYLSVDIPSITHYSQIPFLPVEFFKTQKIMAGKFNPEIEFRSSGTSGVQTSRHLVKEKSIYTTSFTTAFKLFFGKPEEYTILALLPSYLEQSNSSLIYMVNELIKSSEQTESSFYLNDYEKLFHQLKVLRSQNRKTILFGVSYALLDLAESFPIEFPELLVIETGGMKGRRKEMVRGELHKILNKAFQTENILSEYGMTELLSQAYSMGEGLFRTPPWMKILIRDYEDPLSLVENEKTGGINVIDLANIYSCSFISTQDLGRLRENESFEVLGRFDYSDVRGCNLMVV